MPDHKITVTKQVIDKQTYYYATCTCFNLKPTRRLTRQEAREDGQEHLAGSR